MPKLESPPQPATVLELAGRLRPLLLQLNRQLRREVHDLGVTAGQVSLMATIHGSPGLGVNELAQREGMSAPSICGHIDRLEAIGMVTRTRAESGDRRRVGLSVTPAGEKVLRTVRSRRTALLAARLAALNPEERQLIDAATAPLARLLEPA